MPGWMNWDGGFACMLAGGGGTGSVENAAAVVICWASDKAMPHASAASLHFLCLPIDSLPPNAHKMIANLYECKFADSRFKRLIFMMFSTRRCDSVAERHQFRARPPYFSLEFPASGDSLTAQPFEVGSGHPAGFKDDQSGDGIRMLRRQRFE